MTQTNIQSYISRPSYERELDAYRETPDIKVITGVRRCGKSTLLKAFANRLAATAGERNVFYRRMDQFGIPLNPTAEWLEHELVDIIGQCDSSQTLFVLLDEIQDIEGWERVVRRLHTQPGVDVYITGSNAHVLSSDLATLLGGRYVELTVHPLSLAEYAHFAEARGLAFSTPDALFAEYVRYGGMPAQFELPERTEERLAKLLRTIYETIVLNDVAMHARIDDIDLLSKLVRYVFSTSGNLFSTRSIVNALTSAGCKTTAATVDNYLAALRDAFIVGECEQTGLAGKQVLRPLRKFYPIDTGLRNLMTRFSPDDFGFQIECTVFNELIRRGYTVEIGTLPRGEVDFVAHSARSKCYIQVSETMTDQATYERELQPLERIGDSFPKIILTLDRFRTGTTETGVRIVNLVDWLLDGREHWGLGT